jgi:hypothetical protein
MRGYCKPAQNVTEDDQTSKSQVPGYDDNHTTSTDDLENQRSRFNDYEL